MADQNSEQKNTGHQVIERLPLEHPLPKEIQKMTKDDTVCKFCGISYFIHHEVKALEKKVKSLEKDLVDYQAALEREVTLKDEIKSCLEKLAENQDLLKNKEEEILKHENNLTKQTKQIQNLNEAKGQLQDQLHNELTQNSTLRKQNSTMKSKLPDLMFMVKNQRSELTNIHTVVSQRTKLVHETMSTLNAKIFSVCETEISEKESLKSRLSSQEKELLQFKEENRHLESLVKNIEMKATQVEDIEVQLVTSKELCQQLRAQVHKLQNDVDDAVGKYRTAASESAQFREQLRNKTQEVEDIQEQHRKKDLVSDQMFSKYQLELKQKSEELKLANSEIKKSQQKLSERNRIEEEIQRRAEEKMQETEGVRETLHKANEECRALKEERELMITSHQNRIEQLRESFKQKLREAEKWPEKVSEESRKEKNRHTQELKNLEESLKQAFQMEMDIEKQKCEELIEKYKDEIIEVNEQSRNELKSIRSKHKIELTQLQRQTDDAKSSINGIERSYKDEIASLKNIITNLQDRLTHVDQENDETEAQLRAELRESENDLSSVREENQKLEAKINEAREEILFLQETVRRECEERFELTEALSQAREQLLSYQHPMAYSPGSRPSSNSRSSSNYRPSPNSRPLSSTRNQSKERNIPNGAQIVSNSSASNVIPSGKISTSSLNIDFNSSNSKTNSSRTKGGSMLDSRQRIAAAVGRK